ncbi:MAG: hypothetical protein WBB25_04810 [Sulfitobacter sp.]
MEMQDIIVNFDSANGAYACIDTWVLERIAQDADGRASHRPVALSPNTTVSCEDGCYGQVGLALPGRAIATPFAP